MVKKLVEKYDKKAYRLLSMVPGLLTWAILLSPLWLGLIAPNLLVFYIVFLTVFWCYMAIRHSYGVIAGYYRHKREMAVDWLAECNKLDFSSLPEPQTLPPTLAAVKHFILIPAVNEPYEVLKGSIESILNQTFPTKQITLVFTIEQRGEQEVTANIHKVLGDRVNNLDELLIYTHPAGIPGEAIGVAGANRTWGAKKAVEHLKATNKNLRNYIFSTLDSDHVLDRQFIARLTHLYLTSDRRDHKFYSTAVHLFNNNIWQVPALMRIEANSVTLSGLANWVSTSNKRKATFANYSASLQTLIDADYWDVQLGVDDTLFYWRAFFAHDGDFIGAEHYIPYSADAVYSGSYVKSHRSMYKQQLRWGWGVLAIPVSLKGFLTNNKIPATTKIAWTAKLLEEKVMALTTVYLITFGITLITVVNPSAKQLNFSYILPDVISLFLTFAMVLLIPITFYRSKLIIPMPANTPKIKKVLSVLEAPLVVINLFTFSLLPFIEAQTRMMLGKPMKDLYHTPKVRTA